MRIAAQLEGGGDVDGAVEGAGDEASRHRRAPNRRRGRAPKRGRLAQPDVIGRRKRDQAGDQGRGQRRAARQRPEQPQHAIGIHAGRLNGERHQHHDDAKRQHAAFAERLGADVSAPEKRQPEPVHQHRVAALGDQTVDGDDEDPERQAPAARGAKRPPRPGSQARDDHAGARPRKHDGARVCEGDDGEGAEVDSRSGGARVVEWRTAREIGERRPHPPSGSATGGPCDGTATA